MVAINEVRDVYRLEASASGVEQTAAAAQKLAASNEAIVASSEKVERKTLGVERALDRFAAANDRAFKMQQVLARGQALLDRAFEQGLSGTEAYRRAVSSLEAQQGRLIAMNLQAANSNQKLADGFQRLSSAGQEQARALQQQEKLKSQWAAFSAQGVAQARMIGVVTDAQNNSAKATALHAYQWQNLGYQINDVFTSLASGISPMQTLTQQGGQVYQILSSARGGVGGAIKDIGGFLAGLITPSRVAVGGLAAIGITAAVASVSWSNTQAEVRQALAGIGRAAGATSGDIEGIAVTTASATKISVAAARDLTLELARTGKITRENLAPIAAISRDFRATVGGDAAEANQLLASTFAEPGRGAEDLARKYGLLNDAQVRYVRQLDDSNERSRAQQVLLDALRPKLANAADLTSAWASAWERLKRGASDAYTAVEQAVNRAGGGTGGGTDDDQLRVLRQRLDYQRSTVGRAAGSRGGDLEDSNRAIAQTRREIEAIEQRIAKARTDAQEVAKNDLSLRAGLIARATAPELQAYDDLIANRKKLNDAMASQGAGPGTKEQSVALARLDAQIRDYTEAGGALELQERKRANASQIVLDALKARTPAEVGAIASRKALNDAEGTAVLQADRAAAAERARTEAAAAAQKALDDQNGALRRNAEGNGIIGETWRRADEGAAMYAESVRKAAEDVETKGLPADQKLARQQAYLREQLSEQVKERARLTAQKNAESTVDERLAQQVARGAASYEQSVNQRQRDLEVARLQAQASVAEGDQRTALLAQVDDLTSAYARENTVKAQRAAQGMIADQERELAQLRLEADLIGATTLQRERALAVLKAQQDLQRQGIPANSAEGRTYIDNEAMKADLRTMTAEYSRAAQEISSVVSGIFDDMFKASNKGMTGFLDSFSRGFARIGSRMLEQNLIAPLLGGQGGFAGGANPLDAIGKLFDSSGVEKAVKEGSFSGIFDGISEWLKPSGGGSGAKAGGFMSSRLGSGLLAAGVGGSIGYQSQSPLMGALGGGLAGLASGNPIMAVVGAGAGLLGGLFGRSQAARQRQQQRAEEYAQARPQIETLRSQLRGETTAGTEYQIREAYNKAAEAARAAQKGGDNAMLEATWRDFYAFAGRMRATFSRSFEGTLTEVLAGLGTNGPFAQASAAVIQLGDTLKGFVADAIGISPEAGNRAGAAAREAALQSLETPRALSEVETEMRRIEGTGAGLVTVLMELALSADQAAAVIQERTARALDTLRTKFTIDLDRKINDAVGNGYLNEVADLLTERQSLLRDATLLGADTQKVEAYITAAAQKIVDGSELTGDAFTDLVRQFPDLTGRVREFSEAIDETARKAAIASRVLGYQDRLFAATNDTSTLAGQLAAYDRQAQREREEEIRAGGEAMADLERAQYAERLKIVVDYQQQAADAERQRMEAAQQAFDAFARSIKQFVDQMRAGTNSPLSPQARLTEAQAQYNAQLALARTGNRDALDGITGYASTLLDAAKSFYASSSGYQTIFEQIAGQLTALPTQVSPEQFIVNAITDSKTAIVSATQAMQAALHVAIDAGNASATASALLPQFSNLTNTTAGLLNYQQFLQATGGLATLAEQQAAKAIFNSIDSDGDGQLSRLELIRAQAEGTRQQVTYGNTVNESINRGTDYGNRVNEAINAQTEYGNRVNEAINTNTDATNRQVATGNGILNAINGLSSVQNQQLAALNNQFRLDTVLYVAGDPNRQPLVNNMVTALNKIVYNTAGTWSAVAKGNVPAAFSTGGWVRGPGSGTSDSIPAVLSNGEYVVKADVARMHGALLESLNGTGTLSLRAMNDNRMADMPGLVTPMPMPMPVMVGGGDQAAMLVELRRQNVLLQQQVALLQQHIRLAAAAAEDNREGLDDVKDAVSDAGRAQRLLAA